MNTHAYTEDQLVEQPAMRLLGEVVLVSRLRAALERLNPAMPPDAITAAVDVKGERVSPGIQEFSVAIPRGI